MTIREKIAKIIADTNQPGRWDASGKAEKERRLNEADAIVEMLIRDYEGCLVQFITK